MVIPLSDINSIFFGEASGEAVSLYQAVVKGGKAYVDDPARGASAIDVQVLKHVGDLAENDVVLILSGPTGSFVVGKI